MNQNAEKRIHNRIGLQKTVRIFAVLPSKSGNIYEVQKESFEARTSDVSEGGLGLETARPLSPDGLLKINFKLEEDQPVEVYGKVVWSQPNRCGVRFVHTDVSLLKSLRALS